MTEQSCDVVIATRNRPDSLRRCFDGLRRQSVDGFGVIVVDDCSDTAMARSMSPADVANLDVTFITLPEQSGPAAARNAGVAESRAEFIVFVDDDVYANRHFIEAHLAVVTEPHDPDRPIVSCGPFVQPADWVPTPWNLWEARQAKKEADALIRGVWAPSWRNFHTGNNCLPRAVFTELGGFDPVFKRAEDDEFGLRLRRRGCVFRFEPAAIAWHYSNRSLDAWLSIPKAYAYFDVRIDRLYPDEGYLVQKKMERAARRLPLRIARLIFRGQRGTRIGARAATTATRALYRVGAVGPAMGALSVAYDLIYGQSLRESEAAVAGGVGSC